MAFTTISQQLSIGIICALKFCLYAVITASYALACMLTNFLQNLCLGSSIMVAAITVLMINNAQKLQLWYLLIYTSTYRIAQNFDGGKV